MQSGVFQVDNGVTASSSQAPTTSGGSALNGGGIDNSDRSRSLTAPLSTTRPALAASMGLAVAASAATGTLTVTGCTIAGNTGEPAAACPSRARPRSPAAPSPTTRRCSNGGGGIANFRQPPWSPTVPSQATQPPRVAARLFINSNFGGDTLTVVNSTIVGNSVVDAGGGIYNNPGDTVTIADSTIVVQHQGVAERWAGRAYPASRSAGGHDGRCSTPIVYAVTLTSMGPIDIAGAALSSASAYNLIGRAGRCGGGRGFILR